ncbi:ABC transporter ATP-binding protein [Bacillus halotolerans]|uniref:ABC transporter ATP-binding protein n=1 Tax=Bacillus halotolerans TaxID=260554 RepID=A0ABY7HVI9_9BACI|nr:ABC transporter ATP-binding protein [Bacillus halotolerans]KUP32565.1 antibiotic ABC transporter ATP-binding protein [Bacillus halotolerans]MDG0767336.1 ABC transporter ATP-binding protein [Bacillus halotolerans]MEC1544434.1 ABC transporter ATP-binding protein [Bacillus halotolerans]UUI82482.1 ABC transporter ATP-binding protein [Bacillus halotolerans]UYO30222.1 ABC transporter ATP-binding protein [Bacillus halotolerans]
MNSVALIENLKKQYTNKTAVDGISFEVKESEVLGLLGPNGAGKSTTIHILSGVLSATSGNVTILGHNVKNSAKKMKKGIGIVPQDIAIYEDISAEQNVRFFASLYSLKGKELKARVKEALELVQLYDRKDDKPKTFSGGMKRRLNIACAIAHQPKLIIMDEPTVGIDPQSRNHILESIKLLKEKGASIIYSTHYMEEAEAIADRIMIMNEGKIIANGTKDELYKKVNKEMTYSFQLANADKLNKNILMDIVGVIKVHSREDELKVTVRKSQDLLSEIIAELSVQGCSILHMSSQEASLETVFLELTGRNLRD